MSKRLQGSAKGAGSKRKTTTTTVAGTGSKPRAGFLSLEQSMSDQLLQLHRDSQFVCIRDKYPKSRVHLLLVPLPAATAGVRLLKVEQLLELPEPLDFLQRCRDVADDIVASKVCGGSKDDAYPKASDLIVGFHAVQSMAPLHIHIISRDFDSSCLKNKRHWNSFNTDYFIPLDKLMEQVKAAGGDSQAAVLERLRLGRRDELEAMLKKDLKCHKCRADVKNMPELKRHLEASHKVE